MENREVAAGMESGGEMKKVAAGRRTGRRLGLQGVL
jgi:hypothetical protein